MIIVTQLPFVVDAGHLVHELERLLPGRARLRRARQLPPGAHRRQHARRGLGHDPADRRPWCSSAWCSACCIALLLDRKFRGRGVVRTMMITPFLIVPVAAALLWKHALYNPEYGLFNGVLTGSGSCSARRTRRSRTGSATPRCWSVIVALVWQWTPFMMLILLAGLQSRPLDVVEAARIDGADALADLPHMTFPHLRQYLELGAPARVDLHRAELRRRLHHHLRRPGHRQPAVHDLPDLLHRPTTTAGPPPPASSSSSARSSSRPSRCGPCPRLFKEETGDERHHRRRARPGDPHAAAGAADRKKPRGSRSLPQRRSPGSSASCSSLPVAVDGADVLPHRGRRGHQPAVAASRR